MLSLILLAALPAAAFETAYVSFGADAHFARGDNRSYQAERVGFSEDPSYIEHIAPMGVGQGLYLDFTTGVAGEWWMRTAIRRSDNEDLKRLRKLMVQGGYQNLGVHLQRDRVPTYNSIWYEGSVPPGTLVGQMPRVGEHRQDLLAVYWLANDLFKIGGARMVEQNPYMVGLFNELEPGEDESHGVAHTVIDTEYKLVFYGVYMAWNTVELQVLDGGMDIGTIGMSNWFFFLDFENFFAFGGTRMSDTARDTVKEVTGREVDYDGRPLFRMENSIRPVLGYVTDSWPRVGVGLGYGFTSRSTLSWEDHYEGTSGGEDTYYAPDPAIWDGFAPTWRHGPYLQLTIGFD